MPATTVPSTPQAQQRALHLIGLTKNHLKPRFFQTITITKSLVNEAFFEVEQMEPDEVTIMSREIRQNASKDVSNFFKAIKSNFQAMLMTVADAYIQSGPFESWSFEKTIPWRDPVPIEFVPEEHPYLIYFLSNLRVQLGIFAETWDYCELGVWMWQSAENAQLLGLVLLQLVGYTVQHIHNNGTQSFSRPNNANMILNDIIIQAQDRQDYLGNQWDAPQRMWQYRLSMINHSNARRPYKITSEDCRKAFAARTITEMNFPEPLERFP